MKYNYNNFNSQNGYEKLPTNIVEDIGDICLEIEDKGFFIKLEDCLYRSRSSLTISLPEDISLAIVSDGDYTFYRTKLYQYQEICDVVERLKDYMLQNGYSTRIEASEHSASVLSIQCYITLCRNKSAYLWKIQLSFQKNNSNKIRKFKDYLGISFK